jgi:NAD(P)-dependent dehydrogenase (short-subunit alcohol dehydrogenase family)
MRLRDKVVIVTGATGGIGRAIAARAVAEGARVLVHGIDAAAGARTVAELGGAAALHLEDLVDPDAGGRIVAAALRAGDCLGRGL